MKKTKFPAQSSPATKQKSSLGRRLVAIRGERTIAEVVRESGVSRKALYNYENDIAQPTPRIRKRLATYYGIDDREIV